MPFPKKTAADIPPVIARDYAKIPRADAIASADGDGYTKTGPMRKAQQPGGGGSKQFGLPKSGKGMKSMPMRSKC